MNRFWLLSLVLVLAAAGCTRIVEDPRPVRAWPVAPITAGQVSDVLSPQARPEAESNLFADVDPSDCAGLAREVDPPFLFNIGTTPAARSGGQWDGAGGFSVQEMVAIYPANFDAHAALDQVDSALDSCQDETLVVTTMADEVLIFESLPQTDSESADIVLWSMHSPKRACDNAFIAAYNAAIEITACGDRNGYDILELAEQSLDRLHTLANMQS